MQNQSLRWILETLSDFIWLFQVIFTLDLFTAFVAPTHCAVIFNIMFGGEYTTFSPRDMELTGNIPPVSTPESRVVTTPKTQGSVTRRKLLPEFDRDHHHLFKYLQSTMNLQQCMIAICPHQMWNLNGVLFCDFGLQWFYCVLRCWLLFIIIFLDISCIVLPKNF